MKEKILGWGLVVSIGLNIWLTMVVAKPGSVTRSLPGPESTGAVQYVFLSPRIFVDNQNDILINFVSLRKQLLDFAGRVKDGERLGIYFEYLPSGVSIGVNEKDQYVLASLLKVPMVMAIYKQIELGILAENRVLQVAEKNIDPAFGNLWQAGPGTKITIKEAVRLTLTESDNTAKSVLFDALSEGAIEEVFDSLDIPKERDEAGGTVVTPKNYSSILRSLYLASYLDREQANRILEQMAESKFGDKIAAGVPKDVKVAHKIGVYDQLNPNRSIYTDCGIVYVPKRPYILCVMARSAEEKARTWMQEVSRSVYEYVNAANR